MLGIVLGLLTAASWASGSILIRNLARKLDPFTLNAPRALVGGLAALAVTLFTGRSAGYPAIATEQWLFMVGSMMVGGGLGDSLYTASLARIGVSRSYPIANIYPALTLLLGVAFFDETVDAGVVAGLVLVLGGIYIISRPEAPVGELPAAGGKSGGVALALLASLFWAVAMILVAPGTKGLDSVMVASIRVPALAVALFGVVAVRGTWPKLAALSRREWVIIIIGGLVGWGLGSILFVVTIGLLGPTRTAIITSTSPLFALPLSVLFLGERPGRTVLLGTLLTVAGVIVVS